jgi:hypothetical protein
MPEGRGYSARSFLEVAVGCVEHSKRRRVPHLEGASTFVRRHAVKEADTCAPTGLGRAGKSPLPFHLAITSRID